MFNRKKIQINSLKDQLAFQKRETAAELAKMRKRLRRAGSFDYTYLDSPDVKTLSIGLDPETYGQYVIMLTDSVTEDTIRAAEERLAAAISKALIQNELIQFIVREKMDDPLNQFCTVGAKIRIVPWEQMTRTLKVDLTNQPFYMQDPET